MARGEVTDRDKGYKALMRRVHVAAAGAHVEVGVLGEDAAVPHKDAPGLTVGAIGEIHEFGLGHVPVRSWLRGYVDDNRGPIHKRVVRVAEAVEQGKMTIEAGLHALGLSLVGGIRKRIAAGISPTVTARTQARKGPDKTTALINSGQFRSSISHKVEPGA